MNVLHACVAMCLSPTNKDAVDLSTAYAGGGEEDRAAAAAMSRKSPSARSGGLYASKSWEEVIVTRG